MITVEHITKRYGDFTAVDDISFTIGEGHIYGFLGPNGAGKSTTMNIMTGCLSATGGEVKIDGFDIFEEPKQAKRLIGYLPEIPPLYVDETPLEYLQFVAEAKGVPAKQIQEEVRRVVEETHIETMTGRLIKQLSKGYRQRVGIAQALLGNPKYIILDEPTVGLDPLQIIEIRDLIHELGEKHTVILSSHILNEVQAICESVIIIAHGKLIAFDTPDNLEKTLAAANKIELTADATEEKLREILAEFEEIRELECRPQGETTAAALTLNAEDLTDVSRRLFRRFAEKDIPLTQLTPVKADLENIFIELTENSAGTESTEQAEQTPDTAAEQEAKPDESGI